MASNAENVSIWWRHHVRCVVLWVWLQYQLLDYSTKSFTHVLKGWVIGPKDECHGFSEITLRDMDKIDQYQTTANQTNAWSHAETRPSFVQIMLLRLIEACVNQCWHIVNCALGNKIQWNLNHNHHISFREINWKKSSTKWQPYCFGFNILIICNTTGILDTGAWFNIKMPSYQYRNSHCGDKAILRPAYPQSGISYTGKTTYLYWIGPLVTFCSRYFLQQFRSPIQCLSVLCWDVLQ